MEIKLQPGHMIDTLKEEHKMILGFLDELEKVNQKVQKIGNYEQNKEELNKLPDIAEHLVGAEPHHQREEEVLFPEMEKRGVSGPPEVMRKEHKELKLKKKELLDLSKGAQKMNFDNFKVRLTQIADFIVLTLREHIFKENEILYPLALESIKEDEVWKSMKVKCDKIGYCCFTPEV